MDREDCRHLTVVSLHDTGPCPPSSLPPPPQPSFPHPPRSGSGRPFHWIMTAACDRYPALVSGSCPLFPGCGRHPRPSGNTPASSATRTVTVCVDGGLQRGGHLLSDQLCSVEHLLNILLQLTVVAHSIRYSACSLPGWCRFLPQRTKEDIRRPCQGSF